MEIEKTLVLHAPLKRVWELLLDPKVMGGCMPGVQAVEVISDTEYLAEIKVKISFISARFKVRTKIVESQPPHYLRMEGTGEDSSVASSMTQRSELFLTDLGGGQVEIRIKAQADVQGRLGAFGLSATKTKADRMWDEFGANLAAIVTRDEGSGHSTSRNDPRPRATPAVPSVSAEERHGGDPSTGVQHALSMRASEPAAAMAAPGPGSGRTRWWHRFSEGFGAGTIDHSMAAVQRRDTDIYIELHRPGGVVKVLWPASAAAEAVRWLKELS